MKPLRNIDSEYDYIDHIYERLINERKIIEKELRALPKGYLNREIRNNEVIYRHSVPNKENKKRQRNRISYNSEIFNQLCRKAYLSNYLVILESNIKSLSILRKSYKILTSEIIINSLSSTYSGIDKEIFLNNYSSNFSSTNYDKSDYKPENLTTETWFGLNVRSKSEMLIAQELKNAGLNFHYEEVLRLPGGHTHIPDFTIYLDNGEVFYWEHCGLTSDPTYMKNHKLKLQRYEKIGITPWNNLIVTYDDNKGHVNMQRIILEVKLLEKR